MSAFPTDAELARFVCHEARLLDEKRYDEWLALFAADGRYWVPLSPAQTDARTAQSIACEDMLLLRIRVERLKGGKAFSHHPPVACQHVLQAPTVERRDDAANLYDTLAPFLYIEARGEQQIMLTGTLRHRLHAVGTALHIVEKRVDLLNAGAGLPAIYLFP